MSILSKNLSRIKNILDGNYDDSTKIIVGPVHTKPKRNEGDIFIEDDKKWIIKDGVKVCIPKLSNLRKYIIPPYTCPVCSKALISIKDKKCWTFSKMCIDCFVKDDTYKSTIEIKSTILNAYKKQNAIDYLNHMKEYIKSYLNTYESNSFITENGDIEDWNNNLPKDKLKEIFDKKINEFEEYINSI